MTTAFIPAYEFGLGSIPLQIHYNDGKTLIECDCAGVILYYLHGRRARFDDWMSERIRGVSIPGDGAYFEIFDRFGRLSNQPIKFSVDEVNQRLLGVVIWEVPAGAF